MCEALLNLCTLLGALWQMPAWVWREVRSVFFWVSNLKSLVLQCPILPSHRSTMLDARWCLTSKSYGNSRELLVSVQNSTLRCKVFKMCKTVPSVRMFLCKIQSV